MMLKLRAFILFSSLFVCSFAYPSGAGDEIAKAFKSIGFASNVTGSSTYQTQAAGYGSMGSINARSETRNLQVAHVDSPGIRSGCGGIDVFAGGFSFIKSEEIVKFMKNILSNGGGYALNLALETELPEMASSMQFVQSIATKINNFNMGSCELSESLVQGMWPKRRQGQQKLCEEIGMNKSIFSDWASAKQGCATESGFDKTMQQGDLDPNFKDRVLIDKNVVWEAIRKNQFLSSDTQLAEVYMSISGTLVFDKKGGVKNYPSLATNQDFIKALLYGGKLPTYKCEDGNDEKCTVINFSSSTYQEILPSQALVNQVEGLLSDIYQHISTETPLTEEEKGLIGMSNKEVFRLLSSNAQQGVGVQGAHVLAETIAAEILAQFLSNSLNIIRTSLAGKDMEKESLNVIYSNLNKAQLFVNEIEKKSRAQFNDALMTNRLITENVNIAMSRLGSLVSTN